MYDNEFMEQLLQGISVQALLVSNYADDAIALAEKLEKAILSLEESHIEGQKENMDFMLLKDKAQLSDEISR